MIIHTLKIAAVYPFLLVLSALSALPAVAQYTAKAQIMPVPEKGFYNIPLSPEVRAISQFNGNDIRLVDDKGKEIPYLVHIGAPAKTANQFIPYRITEQIIADTIQSVTITNAGNTKISSIFLEMTHADATRSINISGSNDQKIWYVVKDAFYINAAKDVSVPEHYKMLSFPVTNFSYYKITINNGVKQPLQILQAGYFKEEQTVQPVPKRVNGVSFTKKDSSDRYSYLHLDIVPANVIDLIVLHISAPAQYHRDAFISLIPVQRAITRSPAITYPARIALSSDQEASIDINALFGGYKQNSFEIAIENKSNTPLSIDSISAYQLPVTLQAELDPAHTYSLHFGDSTAKAPEYDLIYFKDNIPEHTGTAALKSVEMIKLPAGAMLQVASDPYKYLVWLGLCIAGIVIALLTTRMIRDMKKSENT